MGWPDDGKNQILIKSLAVNSRQKTGDIQHVELLGHGSLNFTRDDEGLKITLPEKKPCEHAFSLKIDGVNLI